MFKAWKRTGLLALVLSAGLAVLQPAVASAADWHDGGGYHDRDRRESYRNDRRDERRDDRWRNENFRRDEHDRRWDVRDRRYYNYAAPNYRYAPQSAYGYGSYPSCPY